MKITTKMIRELIKEELQSVLDEIRGATEKSKVTYNDTRFNTFLVTSFGETLARAKRLDEFGDQGYYVIKQNSPLFKHVNRQHPELQSSGRIIL